MIGRLPKIRRRPSGAAQAAPEDESPGTPGPLGLPLPSGPHAPHGDATPAAHGASDPPTAVLPAVTAPDAGLDPAAAVPVSPSFRDRGKLRRRLRYLRRVRELGYRDLGGLTFDLHRFGRDGAPLVQEKLSALGAVDAELRAVERALGEERTFVDLREAGIAACPRCAALHGSEARFCPSCGIALVGPMAGAVSAPPAGMAAPAAAHTPLWGPAAPPPASPGQPAPGQAAPGPVAPAAFPGPVAPLPVEHPTQIIPAGADAPPAGTPAPSPQPPVPPAGPGAAGAPPADAQPVEGPTPAAVAGGRAAEPPADPRPS
jgi:hypothetical protein